jgi:uncharacterized protein (DUF849 family)
MGKLIINFTPTGMIPTKSQTPYVPITPEEIIQDVKMACEIGITMVHIHARDENGDPCWQKEIYAQIIDGIRQIDPYLIICVSTSGRNFNDLKKRADVLSLNDNLKPDMASLTLSSINFNQQASINEPGMIKDLAASMQDKGIKPELEVFDLGMINYSHYLIKKGLLTAPYYFNLILGNIACAQANLLSAGLMINELPSLSFISLGGIGNYQLKINSLAISMGYGVRIGLEDNIWYDDDRYKLATNIELLQRIHTISKANERSLFSAIELRSALGLKQGNGHYGYDSTGERHGEL